MFISLPELAGHLDDAFGLRGELQALNGYEEQNALLVTAGGQRYICKLAGPGQDRFFIEAQHEMMKHLHAKGLHRGFQQPLPAKDGSLLVALEIAGKPFSLRVLDFLEGDFLVDKPVHSAALLTDIGRSIGQMDAALVDFHHPAFRRYYEWDISQAADARQWLQYISDPAKKRLLSYFLLQFDTEVLPQINSLRKACIHNDANDYNLLVKDDRFAGLIDFGDAVFAPVINNLAVAITYAMLSKPDPLAAAAAVVKGYHEAHALTAVETDLLYYLVAGRLCISLGKSAYNKAQQSDNEHHFVTEAPAWQLIGQWITINPLRAAQVFRSACGLPPVIDDAGFEGLLSRRHDHVGRNLSISYRRKLKIVKGALQYLYDDQGNTYVDCVNNVSHVGHCHPEVVRPMQKQLATLNTNTRYLNDHLVDYAEMLTATLPPKLKVCYFTNSGSEANDLAIRMSRHFTGQQEVIVLDHAYHGTSTVAMEMSPYKFDGKGGFGRRPYIHKAMNPDNYRGPFKKNDPDAGARYAADVTRIIDELSAAGKKPAAFICETLLGVGGQIPLPDGYLRAVYEAVRRQGGICIADEVQVGFGRVGDAFWGFELQGVEPDMVVLGKPIGNGHPLAAVIVTEAVADAFNNGMEYFNTYGGNPVSMVAGKAVLQVIQKEHLQAHARDTGNYLMERLRQLAPKHALIGDVRGHGLFIGVELVRNKVTLEPAVPEIDEIVEEMRNRGYLLSTDGPLHNVLKIKPPLVFDRANADGLVSNLDAVMTGLNF